MTTSRLLPPAAPGQDNICAVFVTYHPEPSFSSHLDVIAPQVGQVVVVDNASDEGAREMLRRATGRHANARLVENAENVGVATALNQGARLAVALSCSWMLALDQDSQPHPNMVRTLCEVQRSHPARSKVAMIGSNYLNEVGRPGALPDRSRGTRDRAMVITSGSLLSLRAYEAVGPFRDDFFIDSIDREYCFRLRRGGFKVVITSEPLMTHACGAPRRHNLLVYQAAVSNHTPLRRYYITRNWLVVLWTYFPHLVGFCLADTLSLAIDTTNAVLLEPDRLGNLRSILLGAWHAVRGRMGRRF